MQQMVKVNNDVCKLPRNLGATLGPVIGILLLMLLINHLHHCFTKKGHTQVPVKILLQIIFAALFWRTWNLFNYIGRIVLYGSTIVYMWRCTCYISLVNICSVRVIIEPQL